MPSPRTRLGPYQIVCSLWAWSGRELFYVTPDGRRFLMIKKGGGTDQTVAPPSLIVVLNWFEELKRLVPTN